MARDASRSMPSASGAFLRIHCRHDQLFETEYKRSNRNRGTKILRCFPHCCPHHVDRSYCGSSLDLAVRVKDGHDKATDLCVFARFETQEMEHGHLNVGQEVSFRHLLSVCQSETNPEASWIYAEQQSKSIVPNSQVFTLNGHSFSKWYYHWESGANKVQRLTKHVLRAYILQRQGQSAGGREAEDAALSDVLLVIGTVDSPPFTVVSHRRSVVESAASPCFINYPPTGTGSTDLTLHQMVQNQITQAFQDFNKSGAKRQLDIDMDDQSVVVNGVKTTTWKKRVSSSDIGELRGRCRCFSNAKLAETLVASKDLERWGWERKNEVTLRKVKEISIIFSFASNLSVDDFIASSTVRLSLMESLQKHWQQFKGVECLQELPCVQDLLQLGLSQPESDPQPRLHTRLLAIMFRLCVWLLSKKTIGFIRSLVEQHSVLLLHRNKLRDAYLHCVSALYDHVNDFLRDHTIGGAASKDISFVRLLSESTITMVFSQARFGDLRSRIRLLLENPSAIGWECFVTQMREAYMRQAFVLRQKELEMSQGRSPIDGQWLLVLRSLRICPSTVAAEKSPPSCWAMLQVLSQIMLFQIYFKLAETVFIRADSSLLSDHNNWMELVCDQKPRACRILPDGLSSLAMMHTTMSLFGVDYVARCCSNGLPSFNLFWWPVCTSSSVQQRPNLHAFRWSVHVALLEHETLAVRLEVSIASLQSTHLEEMYTKNPRERLDLVTTWKPHFVVEAQYRRQV